MEFILENFSQYKNKSGIYKIYLNEHIYIGSSKNLCKRLRYHYHALNKGNHFNPILQSCYDKYKDVYRVVTTIIFMNFYTELLFIMGLDDVIFFALLGLLGAFSYLSRNVINKYVQDVKVLEYIVIAVLYLGFIGGFLLRYIKEENTNA